MEPMLSVTDLKKYFATKEGSLHAVDGVSFDIPEAATLGVVGESGCGKSTLGRVILHLLPRTGGRIVYRGEDISDVSKGRLHELRREMQMIFQDPFSSIDPRMSVAEIIGEPLRIYKRCRSKEEYIARVREVMDTVGLARRVEGYYPHELDGGRRQRVGIGRALALDPRFIVCDEPVSALDVSIQAQILNLMQDLQEDRRLTFMFITHDLGVVKHISSQVIVMYLGVVVEQSNTRGVFERQYHPYTKALMSAIPRVNPDSRRQRMLLRGELSSPINPPNACRFAPRCPFAEEICSRAMPEMQEVSPGHLAACHLVRKINHMDEETNPTP